MRRAVLVGVVLSLAAAPAAAAACTQHPTLASLETEVMCPTCHTTLDQSDSAAAARIRAAIVRWIRGGASSCVIKDRLVAQFGPSLLAAPPRRGFGALAWALPLAGGAAALVALTAAVRRWRAHAGPPPSDAELLEEWL
jgi:cytochrome c-type biogenesis protein CcmH/NrfF